MPITNFAVQDRYQYLEGFGNHQQSEAFPGASPVACNNPQKPPFGLVTERISGSSFTSPRSHCLQTWLYRAKSSMIHSKFKPYGSKTEIPKAHMTPNPLRWMSFPVEQGADWTKTALLAHSGDAATKTGLAIYIYAITEDMKTAHAFSSLDGDMLIIPQSGTIDVQTEMGNLLVRQNEIAMIPRGVRHRVTLPYGPSRGFICELFQGHFRLPELGPIGSCSLANIRDFQVPVAAFDGKLQAGRALGNDRSWTIISRLGGNLFSCTQDHTPFDVAAWNGTFYPFKYDLARFCVLGNTLYDHADPSLFTVLTAPSYREPGTAVVDFAIIPPRWNVMEDTYWLPYYHRNTMAEFSGAIITRQDPDCPWNQGLEFQPYGAALNSGMACHGANSDAHRAAEEQETTPKKVQTEGFTIFLLETECPLWVSDWAIEWKDVLKTREANAKPRL
ncbi:homogentisate 1,2-dioxygenase [Cladophialophora bantiana CBS 173.52]|uniref:homogentisate 1,2-dioxygenase n=1 Tax=Cladophialophora bantiana (strain ATCC 10958 / CBS 173.52 / CDC B-1940 / NIH 8579) TaxID=1442370 RepID=A0A0D2HWL8_CLAB1|nr:homogentisate 1,2-dioxygenase [Cladophialophora bantiana CBS 173.52]KIW97768.1 homogentisate 1,2-dioxygenase [Cladophialophora bantiana CBS 173.52]